MPSMKETARKNLEKMVRGAAREVVSSRPGPDAKRGGATGKPLNSNKAVAARPAPEPVKEAPKRSGAAAAQEDVKPAQSAKVVDPAAPGATGSGISKAALQQLEALIEKNGKTIQKVPIESIKLHENIREAYDDQSLKHLADSLAKDGLIQFPTLALKPQPDGDVAFICKNGHRRILAAKSLGWKTIESVILPFASAKDELYHTIAANLREDVFYLDLAAAYQEAARLGESDQAIAERSGVNPRTVGWYRRLTRMSPETQALARQHSELFNATWAIKLARQGELPPPPVLLKQMQAILARQQAFGQAGENRQEQPAIPVDKAQVKASRDRLKGIFHASSEQSGFAWSLVDQLCTAGYLTPKVLERLKKNFAQNSTRVGRGASRGSAV